MIFKGLTTEVKDIDEKGKLVIAANAIGNVDAQRDISLPGSFNKTISENFARLKWYQNHDQRLLLGVPLEAKEQNMQIQVVGQLNMKKQISQDIYEDYKLYAEHGKTLEHSVGVDAVKFTTKSGIRNVSEWKWWEFSTLTNWGANPNTSLLSIKDAGDLKSAIDWLELTLRKGNFTDTKCVKIDATIKALRSLETEPGTPTQAIQPVDLKNALLQFSNSLKN